MDEQKTNFNVIPASIIIAGILVAGMIYFTSNNNSSSDSKNENNNPPDSSISIENIEPVSKDDHILGNPDASIKLIEFSDLECPFCKSFHNTVVAILEEFGQGDQVAWVFRHFPLTQIHPKALNAAVASECAVEQAGNDAFWKYITRYFSITPSNNNIDLEQLPVMAKDIGLNVDSFNECLISGRYDDKIQSQFQNGLDSGVEGTPYSIIIASNGKKFPISGAQPYETVKSIIEQALSEK